MGDNNKAMRKLKLHAIQDLETFVYRRDSNGENQEWTLSNNGLPESKGTIISILQANPKIKDEFYCLNNRGIYSSVDSVSFEKNKIGEYLSTIAIEFDFKNGGTPVALVFYKDMNYPVNEMAELEYKTKNMEMTDRKSVV